MEEIQFYTDELFSQSELQAKRLWNSECGYFDDDRKLYSVFLSHFALDKRHHAHPMGKIASHVSMRCLFFYGSNMLLSAMKKSIRDSGYELLTCVPLPFVFLNTICNGKTFLENHLHIHF
jgi:hypothetical protein